MRIMRMKQEQRGSKVRTFAFFDDLKQKASQALEKTKEAAREAASATKTTEEEEKEKREAVKETSGDDYEDANPFKTMLQKGMKQPAFISRDDDEEYVNYDKTIDAENDADEDFISAAEKLIPKFNMPKLKMPATVERKKKEQQPKQKAVVEQKEEEVNGAPSNPFAKMLKKSKSVQMTKAAQGERDFDTAIKERVSSKAAAALMEAKDTSTAKWMLTPDSSTSKKRLNKIQLKNGDVLIIGREKGNGIDVGIPLPCVSGVHCQLEMEKNKLYITDLGSTNGTYVDGFQLRKNNRFRVFNQSTVRLGAENNDGEDFASFGTDLEGADEMEKNSEYGQLNYFIEFLGGPKVVINFIFINLAFQGTFFILLKYL